MTRSRQTILVLFALATACGFAWNHYTPHVYKVATSPDHSWSVKVIRQRHLGIPVYSPVDVTAVVADSAGKELLRTTFDTVDLWQDVPTHYSDVICQNDKILIGPEYWDGTRFGHLEIMKADLHSLSGEQPVDGNPH